MSAVYYIFDVISMWIEVSLCIGLFISAVTIVYFGFCLIAERIKEKADIDAEARQYLENYFDEREGRDAMR